MVDGNKAAIVDDTLLPEKEKNKIIEQHHMSF